MDGNMTEREYNKKKAKAERFFAALRDGKLKNKDGGFELEESSEPVTRVNGDIRG